VFMVAIIAASRQWQQQPQPRAGLCLPGIATSPAKPAQSLAAEGFAVCQ
jgi:hypothetical protein